MAASARSRGTSDPGRGGGVSAIRPALLPAHPGPERKVQHPAGRHGILRAHLQTAGYRAGHPAAGCAAPRAGQPSPPSNSTTSGSPTRTRTGCCRTSASPSQPGETDRGGGPHGRRQDDADQPVAALLRCAEGRHPHRRHRHPRVRSRWNCAASSAWFCRIRTCSPERWKTTSGWAPRASGARRWRRPPNR